MTGTRFPVVVEHTAVFERTESETDQECKACEGSGDCEFCQGEHDPTCPYECDGGVCTMCNGEGYFE